MDGRIEWATVGERDGLQHINRIRTNTLPAMTMDHTSLRGTKCGMTVSAAAGEHQRRVNTSAQQVLIFGGLELELEHMGQEKIGVGKEKGAVLRFFTLSNQFNQMKLH